VKSCACFSLLILCGACAAGAEEPYLIYSAVKTAEAPAIDGRLDDACWKKAEQTQPFVAIGGGPVAVQTVGMLAYDQANLYIAIVCPEPAMPRLKGLIDTNDVKDMDESVEIFIDSRYSRSNYLQFRVSILGGRDTHDQINIRNDLTPEWRGAAALNAESWAVEVAIPLSLLGVAVDDASLWGLNLNRQRLMGQGDMWTCWSATKGPFASPHRFGRLIFSPYSTWRKAHYTKQIDELLAQMTTLSKAYPYVESLAQSQIATAGKLDAEYQAEVGKAGAVTAVQCGSQAALAEKLVQEYRRIVDNLRLKIIQSEFAIK